MLVFLVLNRLFIPPLVGVIYPTTITFKEYQPTRSKKSRKRISKASQEKLELPQPLADKSTQPSSNQSQPKVVQPPYDDSIKKNSDAQAVPPRVEVEQKEVGMDVLKV